MTTTTRFPKTLKAAALERARAELRRKVLVALDRVEAELAAVPVRDEGELASMAAAYFLDVVEADLEAGLRCLPHELPLTVHAGADDDGFQFKL